MTKTIGFLGAGQMATALALGFVNSGIVSKDALFAHDALPESGQRFAKATGAILCGSNTELLKKAAVLFLAVKPQQMPEVLREISPAANKKTLFVTIAAGLPIEFYAKHLGEQAKIVRVMPNTPCLVGKGVSAFAASNAVSPDELIMIKALLETVGLAEPVPEKLLDAVTGLSGSGPAFVCMILEAAGDAGVKMGLPRAMAVTFAAQTMVGTAQMVLQTGEHPAVLKDRVTSPAGTTMYGVQVLEERGLRAAIIAAVEAATKRAAELSR